MSYVTLADVYPLIPTLGTLRDAATGPPAVTATVPTATQGAALVALCESEVVAACAAAGVELPVTDAETLAYVRAVICYGGAASVLKAKYPAAAGQGGDDGAAGYWTTRYEAGIAILRAGEIGDAPRAAGTVAHGFKDSAGTALASSTLVTRIGRETAF